MASIETRGAKVKADTVTINGAELYYELRGNGPSVLFIAGATGDGGHFERVAELLSDEFTIVTYDRRANSRSSRTEGWESTSTEEQSDDAAGLIAALGIVPTAVFGTSGGAVIGLDLTIRYPDLLRGVILHEPPMMSVLSDPEGIMGTIQTIVEGGMQRGGPRGAVEAFVRFAAGNESFENLDPQLRERMLNNGGTLFGFEFGTFESYHPDEASLAAVQTPVRVMASTESAPPFVETSGWLAERLGVELETLPGGHAPYFDRPEELAQSIRPLLGWITQHRTS
jgi:pimeloyl-ACP methyl ester carboxylesterase